MLHLLYFITKKSSLSDEAFNRYWKETHGPIAERITQTWRYGQSHRIPFEGTNSPYDGAAEAWIENEAAMDALRQSPEYVNGALVDEANFIDLNRVEWLVTQDHVIKDGPQTPQQVKGIFQLKRKPGWSLEDYRKYWIDVHGPIVCELPGLQRYVQCHTIDAAYRYAEPKWDGVAQLWVEDLAAWDKMVNSKEFIEGGWADGANFLDQSVITNFMAQEHQVKWPA